MQNNEVLDNLRQEIAKLVEKYADEAYKPVPFVPGESVIPPAGKVIGSRIFPGLPRLLRLIHAIPVDPIRDRGRQAL